MMTVYHGWLDRSINQAKAVYCAATAYLTLRVALRNALLRVRNSDTKFCPSAIFRAIEHGEMGVGEATNAFEAMFMKFGDERWMDGVEGTALSFGS